MTISMYQATVPTITRSLTNLIALLEKGAAHAEARKFDPAVLVNSRLYPDMLPLSKQIQLACDFSAKGCARLAHVDVPSTPDTEKTFGELRQRRSFPAGYYFLIAQ